MSKIELSMQQSGEGASPPPMPPHEAAPIAGFLAIGLAFAGIFISGSIFVPLAFVASVIALFCGQIIWGIFGILLSFIGLVTSPLLLTFLGLAWLASMIP